MSENKGYAKIKTPWLRWLFRAPLTAVVSHWFFQGILYMDWGERIFKFLLDVSMALLFLLVIHQWLNLWVSFLFAILLAHTLNFIFNAHLWGALKHYGLVRNTFEAYHRYVELLEGRINAEVSLQEWFLIGSQLEGEWTPGSDIDLRLVRKSGWGNWLKACIFVMVERSRAFFAHFPMDIYVIDNLDHLLKMEKGQIEKE